MSSGTGVMTFDFGAAPGSNEASVTVTGLSAISATTKVDAFIMADDTTSDHTAKDHRYFAALVAITCGTPTAATGFTAYATSQQKLTGTYKARYVYAD